MMKCCNFLCPNKVSAADYQQSKTLKFVLSKEKCEKVESQLCFCDGTITKSKNCLAQYNYVKSKVENENEGGPFGTPMR